MDLRYPIGRFTPDAESTSENRSRHIDGIASLPRRFRKATTGLTEQQLDTPYRDGGWTVRQLVHHVPDSHLNAYVRCKLALTEDVPTIKPYDENAWSKLRDTELTPIEISLALLEAIHHRWTTLLRNLRVTDFQRKFNHPEAGVHDIDWLIASYDWHGNHHLAHVNSLRERMKW